MYALIVFTDQIDAIQSYSISALMCEHYDFDEIHYPNAFLSTYVFNIACISTFPQWISFDIFSPLNAFFKPRLHSGCTLWRIFNASKCAIHLGIKA